MTTTTSTADHRSLYEVTGDIKDINTLLVPRAALASPAQPVGWAIFAENGNGLVWTQNKGHAEASAKNVGLQVTPLYAAPQSAVPRNAPLYSPDDVAFPVQRSAEGADVPPELASTARPASTAAAEVAAPSGAGE